MPWPCLTTLVGESQEGLGARAAPDLRRGTRHDVGLAVDKSAACDLKVDVCKAERRVTNQKGVRDAKGVGGAKRERLRQG